MDDDPVRDGRFGWRGWLGVLVGLTTVGAFLLGLGALGRLAGPHPHPHPRPTASRLTNEGYAYWYCWDVGNPHPHHFGAMVHGDHLCTEAELQQGTETP